MEKCKKTPKGVPEGIPVRIFERVSGSEAKFFFLEWCAKKYNVRKKIENAITLEKYNISFRLKFRRFFSQTYRPKNEIFTAAISNALKITAYYV